MRGTAGCFNALIWPSAICANAIVRSCSSDGTVMALSPRAGRGPAHPTSDAPAGPFAAPLRQARQCEVNSRRWERGEKIMCRQHVSVATAPRVVGYANTTEPNPRAPALGLEAGRAKQEGREMGFGGVLGSGGLARRCGARTGAGGVE